MKECLLMARLKGKASIVLLIIGIVMKVEKFVFCNFRRLEWGLDVRERTRSVCRIIRVRRRVLKLITTRIRITKGFGERKCVQWRIWQRRALWVMHDRILKWRPILGWSDDYRWPNFERRSRNLPLVRWSKIWRTILRGLGKWSWAVYLVYESCNYKH